MYQFSNNASTLINTPVAIGDLTINVADASEFPAVSVANPCFATIEQAPPDPETKLSNPAIEIVLVTGVVGNTLTVVRGQDGTTARAWVVGDYCENRITKAALDDFTQEEELTAALATKADQSALDTHEADFANPHAVTAAQAGADPAGSASTVQGNLDTHEADFANPHQVTAEQIAAADKVNGFVNRTDSVLSFDDPTRTFTITPAVAEFVFWSGGIKYTKSAPESIVIPAVTGGYYFYYDQSGVLQTAMDWDDELYKDVAYVAATFLDAVHGETVILSDERHGTVMDYATVLSERATEGASYEAGLLPGDITPDGSGDLDIHAQISVGSGFYWNQDIRFEIPGKILPSDIPFVYREGMGQGTWHRVPANSFVCYTEGGSRPLWNEDTGTVFQLTEITNNDFICMHLYATNDPLQPWVWLIGQDRYVNLTQARQGALVEVNTINIGGYPAIEQMVVATFIVQGSDGYTNPVKARIRTTDTGADFIDWRNVRVGVGSTGGAVTAWGDITGDIVNQADLQAELDGKETAGAAATVQTNLDTHEADLANPHATTAAQTGAEPDLGDPTVDGYVLSSTIAGVRSWIANGSGGTGIPEPAADSIPKTRLNTGAAQTWENERVVPDGGDTGQLIIKQSATEQDAAWADIPIAFSSVWRFDTSTVAADPGVGDFRLNAATQALTTQIYLNEETISGIGVGALLPDLAIGEKFIIFQSASVTKAMLCEIASAPIDNGAWWTVPVTVLDTGSGGEFQAGKRCTFDFFGIGGIDTVAWGEIVGTLSDQLDLQAALDGKETAGAAATVQTNLDTHVGDLANPHAVTAAQVGAVPYAPAVTTNIIATAIGVIPLTIKKLLGATASLFRVRDENNSDKFIIDVNGRTNGYGAGCTFSANSTYGGASIQAFRFRVLDATPTVTVGVSAESEDAGIIPLAATGAVGQTANLLEVRGSDSIPVNGFDPVGNLLRGVNSDITGVTGADLVNNCISLTQVEYDAITTPDASTLYLITG